MGRTILESFHKMPCNRLPADKLQASEGPGNCPYCHPGLCYANNEILDRRKTITSVKPSTRHGTTRQRFIFTYNDGPRSEENSQWKTIIVRFLSDP